MLRNHGATIKREAVLFFIFSPGNKNGGFLVIQKKRTNTLRTKIENLFCHTSIRSHTSIAIC